MNQAEMERRLQMLEDIEAIKQLKGRYCYYCDAGYDPDGIESCFAEDAIREGGSFGTYRGRKAICEFFVKTAPTALSFAMHLVMNPVIEVNGDKAKGRWYIFEPVTFADGQQAGWLAGGLRRRLRQGRRPMEVPAPPFQALPLDAVQQAVVEPQIWARVNAGRFQRAQWQDSKKVSR